MPWDSSCNHMLRGSGSTVVTMTSKVNGEMEILSPYRSETPKDIEAFTISSGNSQFQLQVCHGKESSLILDVCFNVNVNVKCKFI